jgi:hypothetical protein
VKERGEQGQLWNLGVLNLGRRITRAQLPTSVQPRTAAPERDEFAAATQYGIEPGTLKVDTNA